MDGLFLCLFLLAFHIPKYFSGRFLMNQNLLTINELADQLKVPKSWLYSRTRQTGPGTIPRMRVGKYLRFHLDEVMNWLKEQQDDDRDS